jgi:hypothetical protein
MARYLLLGAGGGGRTSVAGAAAGGVARPARDRARQSPNCVVVEPYLQRRYGNGPEVNRCSFALLWYVREHHSEARMWLQRALERPSEATAARAKVLSVPGDSPGSRESLGEAMCCSKKVSPYIGNWAITRVLPLRYLAKSNFQRSLDISRDLEDAEGIALSLLYLGRRLRTSSSPLWGSAEAAGIPRRCTRSQRFAPI